MERNRIAGRAAGHGRRSLMAGTLLAVAAGGVVAQEEPPPQGWAFKGELTSVLSGGNGEALTFGIGGLAENRRGANYWRFETGGIRTEATRVTRRAVGTADVYVVEEDEDRQRTADAYYARARYDRQLSEHFFAFSGLDWLRNTFAGVDSRFLMALGGGNTWIEHEATRLKTNYAVTYTFQSDLVENPFVKSNFPGVRAGWEYFRRATATTEFESTMVADMSLDETEDIRFDLTNSLNVAISSALALKPSLQVLWRNLPSYTEVDLFSPGGTPLDTKVLTPLEKLDYFFKVALVVRL